MIPLDGIVHRVRGFFRRGTADAETREELEDHIARQTRKHIAAGMEPADAARIARIELGGVERWREETAAARPGYVVEGLIADARYALRGLRRRPTFAAIAVLTLALGLGAGSAVYSIVDGALARPLPFPAPARLMSISLRMPARGSRDLLDMVWSYPKFLMFRDQQTAFSDLALHSAETIGVDGSDGSDGTERVSGEAVTSSYFALLGATPAMGRPLLPAEDLIGAGRSVVVLSDAFWRTRLGADPHVLTRVIDVEGQPRTIVGVMPPGFRGLSGDAELWIPVSAARSAAVLAMPDAHNLELIGRLRAGVTRSAARQAVDALGARIDGVYPSDDGHWGADAVALDDLRVAPPVRRALLLLAAAVALMIVIVCVNLTTLFFTRGIARRGELAVRVAIGAGRGRVVQQVVVEAMICALAGALLALAIGLGATRYLASAFSSAIPTTGSQTQLTRLSFSMIEFGGRAIVVTFVAALLIGGIIGIATSLRATRYGLVESLRQSATGAGSSSRRGGLVVAQIALAMLLLVVAGLTVDSLQRVLRIPLGYRADRVLSVKIMLDPRRTAAEAPQFLWQAALGELAALPGVASVALGSCAPIGMHCDGTSITPAGHPGATHVAYHEISNDYFHTLGTPVLRGREFAPTDPVGTERVAIINESAARTIWGSDDPLVTPIVNDGRTTRVVGIVADARYEDPELPAAPAVFVPIAQTSRSRGVIFVRTTGEAASAAADVRNALRRAGKGNALGDVRSLSARLGEALARNRLIAEIVSGFAAAALLLAALGVYGSLSLTVMQRSRELAIRRALGADRASLVGMVLAHAARLGAIGGAIGLTAAWLVARAAAALLYDARPLAPAVYGGSVLLLAVSIAAASTVPSIRSMRADPRDAMRME